MALRNHWLDDIFEVPEKALSQLLRSDKFIGAVNAAQKAYYETKAHLEAHPDVIGMCPAQSARLKFLEIIAERQ